MELLHSIISPKGFGLNGNYFLNFVHLSVYTSIAWIMANTSKNTKNEYHVHFIGKYRASLHSIIQFVLVTINLVDIFGSNRGDKRCTSWTLADRQTNLWTDKSFLNNSKTQNANCELRTKSLTLEILWQYLCQTDHF